MILKIVRLNFPSLITKIWLDQETKKTHWVLCNIWVVNVLIYKLWLYKANPVMQMFIPFFLYLQVIVSGFQLCLGLR